MRLPNPVREKLQRGEVSIGSFLNLASPVAAEVMAVAGYEWLVVDAEHAQWDLGLIVEGIRAIEAQGCVPLVRPWSHDPTAFARILDAGAQGLVIPHVSTAEQARAIAKAVRYTPHGERSAGTGRGTIAPDWRAKINDNLLICPQIEDLEGVNNAAAIMAVDGMDVAFIGPSDLALSMGLSTADAFKHPDHVAAIAKILAGAKANRKPAGTPVGTVEIARNAIKQGFQFIDYASDFRILQAAAAEQLKAIKA
ncbi:MAG: 2-dehydro-3-deoxyglucarate aldolase [Actinobacteria bacterium]|nr:2-dehydro-3-deoxyglucarate aldolase [Actinomycetota bacterium]